MTTTATRVLAAALLVAVCASPAVAQTTLRVTQETATIWTTGVPTVAAIVQAGTELAVVAQRGDWYEVVLPIQPTTTRRTGLIAASQVEVVSDDSSPARATPMAPASRPREQPPAALSESATRPARFRAFGQLAYGRFAAGESFDAVFDRSGGMWFGGGGTYRFGSAFVQASIERFRRTGERVFVFDEEIFRLGLENTVTLTPITLTGGYYFGRPTASPYAGGGVGRYLLKEQSEFAESGDDVSDQFMSYHLLGGMEWNGGGLFGTAFEVQYTHVPGALDGGVARVFGENNLGGVQFRVRVLIGR